MKTLCPFTALALATALRAMAQNVTVPSTCTAGFESGSDEVIYTVPYTYTQVMSIIGSYKNLTWSGNPPNTVTLNGTNNEVGTARTYNIDGAHVIETILVYSKPPAPGPYDEVHNTALLTIPSVGLKFYIPYDGTTVTSECNGLAARFNFTAHFCANNATASGQALHMIHLGDAVTVGKFLGGQNFTSCAALQANSTASSSASASASSAVASATGAATMNYGSGFGALLFAGAALLM